MARDNKGFSLFDVVLVLAIAGIIGYFAIQKYYLWSEKFNAQEAINHLKKIKNNIELCFWSKDSVEEINNCIDNPSIQNSDTIHFKCCGTENTTKDKKSVSYFIYALRNDRAMIVLDPGGDQPACMEGEKTQERASSGAILCRNTDGTNKILGWGIYQGVYQ